MEPEKSNGALVGSIIIIAILVLGGLYLWKTSTDKTPAPSTDTLLEGESNTNVTTDTDAIEQELDSMDLEGLDSEI